MEGADDLELSEQNPSSSSSTQPVRKNIALKLKPSPKGRGRPKKATRSSSTKRPSKQSSSSSSTSSRAEPPEEPAKENLLQHEDVLHLSVSGIKPSNSNEPLHQGKRLDWQHKVTLIGQKVLDPSIHCCEKCSLPILIYGRMIPCKHVFCLDCAKKHESTKVCPRCSDPVTRIEQSALGTVFVCTIGGPKHGTKGCRRTYLSPRDLKAHVDHRHMKALQQQVQHAGGAAVGLTSPGAPLPVEYKTHTSMDTQPAPPPPPPQPSHAPLEVYRTRQPPDITHHLHPPPPTAAPLHHPPPSHQPPPPPQQHHPPHPPPPQHTQGTVESYQTIPIMTTSRSTNLITVPIQDEAGPYRRHAEPPQHGAPPPQQQPYPPPYAGPPQYHTAHPPPPHSSGYVAPPPGAYSGNPPHHSQPVMPPLSHQPPTSSHHAGPPPTRPPHPHPPSGSGPPPPQHYSTSRHYDDQHPRTPPYLPPGGHSPRTPWPNNQGPRGPPPAPAPQRSGNSSMPPPSRGSDGYHKQYYQ